MSHKNAIEERLDLVEEEWFAFTDDPEARLGVWRLDGDGIQLVEVFLETQTEPGTAVPDFFMRLRVPFEDPDHHGVHLRNSFIEEIDAAKGEMAEAGVDPDWPVPALDPHGTDLGQLLSCLEAFRSYYADLVERLIVVVLPTDISQEGDWSAWLDCLVTQGLPENIRFMVFDDSRAPALDSLTERHPALVRTMAPELDMPGALDSLARQVGGTGPPDIFRRMFVGMGTAAMRGNVLGALALGGFALTVARRQGWTQQVAVIHMALGTLLLGAGRTPEALVAFRAGGKASLASRDQGDPGSGKVVLQAKLAEAGALIQEGEYDNAAGAYEEAVSINTSQQEGDPVLLLESHRMAAYCHEQSGRTEEAWQHLASTLDAAEEVPEAQRIDTTLPFVVQAFTRLWTDYPFNRRRSEVEQRLTELLGPEWPALVEERLPS